MAYGDRRQPASFKGVPFFVLATAATKGRRVPVRRLAGQDGSKQQDLGRNEDAFSITAFVAGADYDLARNELETALTEPGPGALVLPTRGELWARVLDLVVDENKDEAGFCTFRFSVVIEDRNAGSLRTLTDTAGTLRKASANLATVAEEEFVETFDTASMPSKYLTAPARAIAQVTDTLRTAQRNIYGALNAADSLTGEIEEISNGVNALLSAPSALASKLVATTMAVIGLADTVRAGIDRTTGLPKVVGSAFSNAASTRVTQRASKLLAGLGSSSPGEASTPLADRAAKNTRAIYRVSRASALARSAETFSRSPFDSSSLALSVLNDMRDEVDALLEYSAGDALFQALVDLRAAATQHLTQTATNLPKTVEYKVRTEIPALLIAHGLYGDARREAEIVARNRIPHPLFVSASIIEVVDGGSE
jgi:prophage DNA circulation protein